MAPATPKWPLDPHTKAKHVILRAYLNAWFPILSNGNSRLIYIDGFAGPGRYEGEDGQPGDDGSPIIALKAALEHKAKLAPNLVFGFIEEDPRRIESLRAEVKALDIPKSYTVEIDDRQFAPAVKELLDAVDQAGYTLAPTFAFIDPFGIKGVPFTLVERLLKKPSCEVLVTVMTGPIQRWVTEIEKHVCDLLGDEGAAAEIAAAADRVKAARKIYERSLRRVAKYVRYFSMTNKKRVSIYDLFFASNHPLGHYRMKEAMWKAADQSVDLSFSDATDPNQTVLFEGDVSERVAKLLLKEFAGRTVDASDVKEFIRNESPYLEKHCRSGLIALEAGAFGLPKIGIPALHGGKKRRKDTYPAGLPITFPVS